MSIDQTIRDKFLNLYEQIVSGELDHWKQDHIGRLAQIIVLDNLSRNMFRGTAKAFATDPKAYELAKVITDDLSIFNQYKDLEKFSILLVLMHREDATVIKKCNELMELQIKVSMDAGNDRMADHWTLGLMFGKSHLVPVEKFGRYPTRNEAIGRENTQEETDFLKNAESWG